MSSGVASAVAPAWVERVRADFPALAKPWAYLDNAATSQKPRAVVEAVRQLYEQGSANVHRGVYRRAAEVSDAYEAVRTSVARFLGAAESGEIVFTRGTTEAINLLARTYVLRRLQKGLRGNAILITALEHHANIVPWQLLAGDAGARLLVAPLDERGEVILEEWQRLLGEGVAFASCAHVSNVLGTVNPVAEMVRLAHEREVPVLVDGAQAAPHFLARPAELDCDFYTVSSHKLFGPTGVGVLWGRRRFLEQMPPWQGGGDMIRSVSFERTAYAEPPFRFEAGTPNIDGTIGFGAALGYLEGLDQPALAAHEAALAAYAEAALLGIPGLTLHGRARERVGVFSFTLADAHAHDIATILDSVGVAVRAGHHCAQPLMERLGVPATARASFAFYNTFEEVDRLVAGLARVGEIFGG
jgi:cysteine desulfurase / selenocysteine lyase